MLKIFSELAIPLITVGVLYFIWGVFIKNPILPESTDVFKTAQEGAKTLGVAVFLSVLTIITSFT